MRYWWVNHNQTFSQEFKGGYIWCPKRKNNNNRNHFYETLREVKPGDLILSFAKRALQGYGYAKSTCYSAPRPEDFGKVGKAWNKIGWRVDVTFQQFSGPLRPVEVFPKIKSMLPAKYSPLNQSGKGNQGAYLAEISYRLAQTLMELAGADGLRFFDKQFFVDGELATIKQWEDIEEEKINELLIEATTKETLIHTRRGQGKFRSEVLKIEHSCRITNVSNANYLIASHIKPWRECDNHERLSNANGLMLTPSVDFLFDRGLITFANDGELHTSPVVDTASLELMKIPINQGFNTGKFNAEQKHFLDYHRSYIFLESAK